MAWNEPGGPKDNDPWGGKQNNGEKGPPDLDEVVRNIQQKLGGLFGGKGGSGGGSGGPLKGGALGIGIIVGIAFVVWLASGIYIVGPAERGVVLRFGASQATTTPGPHWHLPYPIETVRKVNVEEIRHTELGYRSSGRNQEVITAVPKEALMLTRDENIVDVQFAIQYRVKNASDFLFNVKEPTVTLKQSAESAIREVVGKSNMDFVLTEGRSEIAAQVRELTQEILDRYESGLIITSVNMQDAQPPEQVQAAFDDAVKAREDEERLKNEAQAYANDILPKARGRAARLIEEANAYKDQMIAKSQGEASRFEQVLAEYQKAPGVTRERLYLETIEDVLTKTNKVMVDVNGGNNLLFLPLDKLAGNQSGGSVTDEFKQQDLFPPAFSGSMSGDNGRQSNSRMPTRPSRSNSSREAR